MAEFDYDGALDIERAWREGLMPDPLLTVSEWSDRHRMLSSKASAEPGRWRTSRTPYLKAIMDCLSPTSPVERIVFMKGAQLGAPLALTTPIPTPTEPSLTNFRLGILDPAMGWPPLPEAASECQSGDAIFPPTRRGDRDEDHERWYRSGKERHPGT